MENGKYLDLKGKTLDFSDQEYNIPKSVYCYQYLIDQTILFIQNGSSFLQNSKKIIINEIQNSGNKLIDSHTLLKKSVLWIHLSFLLVVFVTMSDLVSDKKSGRRQFFESIGVSGSIQTLSWIIKTLIISLIIISCFLIGFKIPLNGISILNYTNIGIYYLLSSIYCFGILSFIFLSSVLYSDIKLSKYYWSSIHILLQLPLTLYIVDDYEKLNRNLKLALSFNPCMAFYFNFHLVSKYEILGIGLNYKNIFERLPEDDIRCIEIIACSIISSIIMSLMYLLISNFDKIQYLHSYYKQLRLTNKDTRKSSCHPNIDEENGFYETIREDSASIVMKRINKYYKEKSILKNINVKIKEKSITCIFGYAGSGKSTILNIISGMDKNYVGKIYYKDHTGKIKTKLKRNEVGYFPQKLSLYDCFTIKEQIELVMRLKEVQCDEILIESLLKRFKISKEMHDSCKDLSWVNQRKLCLLLAFTGENDLLVVDEPTVGLRSDQIKEVWKILAKEKAKGKTIIVGTHFIEEAQNISDTIAFLLDGVIKSYSGLANLETHLNKDYELKLIKSPFKNFDFRILEQFLDEKMKNCEILRENCTEQVWLLPKENYKLFPSLMSHFESESLKEKMGISHYILKNQSIEDLLYGTVTNKKLSNISSNSSIIGEAKKYSFVRGFLNHINSMMMKKRAFFLRRLWTFLSSIIVANLFILIIASLNPNVFRENSRKAVRNLVRNPPIPIKPSYYSGAHHLIAYQNKTNNDIAIHLQATYKDLGLKGEIVKTRDKQEFLDNILQDDQIDYSKKTNWKYETAFWIDKSNVPELYYGSRYTLSKFLVHNILSNSLLKKAGKTTNIKMMIEPYEIDFNSNTQRDPNIKKALCHFSNWFYSVICALCIGLSILISLIPSCMLILKEEASGFKDTQILCGLTLRTYWLSNIIVDILISSSTLLLIVPYTIFNGSLAIVHASSNIIILVFLFTIALISFIYFTIILLPSPFKSTATIIGLNFLIIIFFYNFSLVFWTEIIKWRVIPYPSIQYMYSLLHPNNCLANGLMKILNKDYCSSVTYSYDNSNLFTINSDVITLIIQIFIYQMLVFRLEYGSFKNIFKSFWSNTKHKHKRSRSKKFSNNTDDNLKTTNSELQKYPIGTIQHQERAIKTNLKYAVKTKSIVLNDIFRKMSRFDIGPITLGVDENDSLALLGKYRNKGSEIFNMIIGKRNYSRGAIWVNGRNIKEELLYVHQDIDYFPSSYPLLGELTVKEILITASQLCCFRNSEIKPIIDRLLKYLDLEDLANMEVESLSKGQKKIVRLAITLLKRPNILLIDEPSVAVDPSKKKLIWNVLSNLLSSGQTLILNTHNLEECEMLCNKIVIISKGQLICYGSKDFLINSLTSGYKLNLKFSKINQEIPIENRIKNFEKTWTSHEDRKITSKDNGDVEIHLQSTNISWSEIFKDLKEAIEKFGIENFSLQKCYAKEVRKYVLQKEKEEIDEKSDPAYDYKV